MEGQMESGDWQEATGLLGGVCRVAVRLGQALRGIPVAVVLMERDLIAFVFLLFVTCVIIGDDPGCLHFFFDCFRG